MQQLLWLETLLKFSAGIALAVFPIVTVRMLGLPRPEQSFWPRVCGVLLLGIAAALFLEGTTAGHGLGLAGVIVINLCGVALLASMLVLDRGPASMRGRTAVWLVVCVLVALSAIEAALV